MSKLLPHVVTAFDDDGAPVIEVDFVPAEQALGGGIEGAERTKRETMLWTPSMLSPDRAINMAKPEADARTRDMVTNDGFSQGAVRLQKNGIVGSQYRLNAKPDYRVIYGKDNRAAQEYGEELAAVAEARFNLAAQSDNGWFDAGENMTLTEMIRLVVGSVAVAGEAYGAVEWIRSTRPFSTAIQMISPDRICNRDFLEDGNISFNRRRRRGIITDARGKIVEFEVMNEHPSDHYEIGAPRWKTIPAQLPWGRKQMLFVRETQHIDQSRGLSEMVAALQHVRMTKKFSEITLQNAVVNASYAAAIESELPSPEIVASMGGSADGWVQAIGQYMTMLQGYLGNSENIAIDGAKMPHLFPGTKMKLTPMGTPGGVGSDFEASLLRKIAATLGLSYADLSRDFARMSYSGLKGELAIAERDIEVKKKMWADRWATGVYRLWFEEEMAAGNLPLPPGRNRTDFYRDGGLLKDAYTRCTWIGTSRGQIDEMKETQAALLRIAGGLSTYEKEAARLGEDYREIIAQRAKEGRQIADAGVTFHIATKVSAGAGTGGSQNQANDNTDQDDDEPMNREEA